MRGVKVFSGTSHPALTEAICQRLGTTPAKVDLGYFANGEIRVQIGTSIRNEDVFIVQSGSQSINDSVMELLIMIAACKGGSAKSITAVMPYFPYSRQSKKKAHRGAITAKMIANLMVVAGVSHVITVDLHSSQMRGFFGKPVDNLLAEPIIVRWIKTNVRDWKDAVVVSKNVGGTKRVTSLADVLKLSFALISTDRARTQRTQQQSSMMDSAIFFDAVEPQSLRTQAREDTEDDGDGDVANSGTAGQSSLRRRRADRDRSKPQANGLHTPSRPKAVTIAPSPTMHQPAEMSRSPSPNRLTRAETLPSARRPSEYEASEAFNDEKARDVIISRLIHGHVVDDDHPSPALSGMSASAAALPERHPLDAVEDSGNDPMTSSFVSTTSSLRPDHALGGSFDAAATSDEEEAGMKNPELEHTVTLVGDVKERTVLIMDDIIDRSASWVAAAETCVKRGLARKVYCIGIHALFEAESLEELERCDCIDHIVVTNTFPIASEKLKMSKKLIVIDLSNLLSEAIRRNHHGGEIRHAAS
jgi:ribose-phosphate pyrophosphokinase